MRSVRRHGTQAEVGEGKGKGTVQALLPSPGDEGLLGPGKSARDINNFGARHHPLLHEALVTGWAMLVQEVGGGLNQVYMC